MDPTEAYIYLVNLLEKTNSLMGSLIVRDINLESENKEKYRQRHRDSTSEDSHRKDSEENKEIDMEVLIQEKENELYFTPDKGNVVFCSAIDCWGFTLESFSEILTKTIGFKKEIITKLLWGDYYFNKSNKKVYKTPVNSNSKPMFVEFVLNNIYKLYKLALVEKNLEAITKAANTLNVEILKSEFNMFEKNPRNVLRVVYNLFDN
jgi:ribosome assembly protein 1